MIKAKKREEKPPLTVETVLSKVDEYSIYRYYLGHDFRVGKAFSSPMPGRRDSSPSFRIDKLNYGLYHCDFGSMSYRGDCIDFVRQLYGYSLQDALKMIDKDFGLGISSGEKFSIRTAPVYKVPKIEEKKPVFIQFTGNQRFSRSYEYSYWNNYHFSFDILKGENVFCVRSLYIDREKFTLPKEEPVFAYYEEGIGVKIYRPLANKAKKEWKWKSTIPFTFIHGLNKMQPCKKIVSFKSQKDRICGLHFLDQALALQAESLAAINDESLLRIRGLSEEQWLCFGTDSQGKKESMIITGQLGMCHINMPDSYMPANDPSEVAKQYSIETVQQHFITKGILNNLKQKV
jgi:hypothetical protein